VARKIAILIHERRKGWLTCSSKERVPLDYISAYTWYSAAAASGMHKSADRMKSLEQVMLPEQIRIAKSRALAWTAEHGHAGETRSEQK